MSKWICVVGILLALLFVTSASTIGLMNIRSGLESDLECAEADATEWKIESNRWMNQYLNYDCPPCPEPEILIKYNNKTIWNNETIYIDNAIFDVNRDWVVDYNDACEILYYIKYGISTCEQICFNKYGNPYEKLYDVNRDGKVNRDDVALVWENSS